MTTAYSADIDDDFFPAVETLCTDLKCDPFDLLGVWMSESGIHHNALNPHGHASGIFQAMPATLHGLGFMGAPEQAATDFRAQNATGQLHWARSYYMPARGRLVSKSAAYLWTFIPADIGLAGDPDAIISAKVGSNVCPDGRRSAIFDVNAGFDDDGDLAIEVHELDDHIDRACTGPRWAEVRDRMRVQLGLEPLGTTDDGPAPITTALGIQQALDLLGFEPGELDGYMGPKTRLALVAFQAAHGLKPDGIPGPNTRALLKASAG